MHRLFIAALACLISVSVFGQKKYTNYEFKHEAKDSIAMNHLALEIESIRLDLIAFRDSIISIDTVKVKKYISKSKKNKKQTNLINKYYNYSSHISELNERLKSKTYYLNYIEDFGYKTILLKDLKNEINLDGYYSFNGFRIDNSFLCVELYEGDSIVKSISRIYSPVKSSDQSDFSYSPIISWYNNGQLHFNKQINKNAVWFSNGTLKIDRLNFPGKEWYENGKLKDNFSIVDGVRSGPSLSYYRNGNIKYEENFLNGELNGVQIYYHENGNIKNEYNYLNGSVIGVWKSYFENGQLESLENFKEDNYHGKQKYYYENGKLSSIENYIHDEHHGQQKYYYENGKLSYLENYDYGTPKGEHKGWYENGQIQYKYFVDKDMDGVTNILGLAKWWDPEGQISCEFKTIVIDDFIEYQYKKKYYSNGNLKTLIKYNTMGTPYERREYFENGNLAGIAGYDDSNDYGYGAMWVFYSCFSYYDGSEWDCNMLEERVLNLNWPTEYMDSRWDGECDSD